MPPNYCEWKHQTHSFSEGPMSLTECLSSAWGSFHDDSGHFAEVVPVERRSPTKKGTEHRYHQAFKVFSAMAPEALKVIQPTVKIYLYLAKGSSRKIANPA